jgi:hypothetical protein
MSDVVVFKIPKHIISRQMHEDTVILDLAAGMYYGLSGAGSAIWQGVATGKGVRECAKIVSQLFDVDISEAEKDVEALLRDLVEKKIVEPS